MSLRLKILSGFLILTIMLFVAGGMSIYELVSVGTSVQKLLDDNYKSINAAKMMIEALEREDSGVLLILSGKWEEGRSTVTAGDSLFQKGFDIAQHNVTIPGEHNYVNAIEKKYKVYKNLWVKPIAGTKNEDNVNWYFQEIHNAFQEVKSAVEELTALNDRAMYQTASMLKNKAHRAIMPGIIAILSAFVFTAVFNFFIHYYVVSPIIEITRGIRLFTAIRKPFDVKIETKDELFHLMSSVQELLAQSQNNMECRNKNSAGDETKK